MKKLIVTLEYPPQVGGIASYVYNLAAHLPLAETVVYAPKMPGAKEFDSNNAWPTYRLNPYLLFFWPRWLAMLWQVWGIVNLEKITHIYVQQVLPVGYVAYLLKKIKKIPYTIFLHGTDVNYAMRQLKRAKFRKVCQFADEIVVNSQFLKTKIESRIDNLPKITVIYPCPADFFYDRVNPAELAQLKSTLALTGKKIMLSVARLTDGKGFPHLIRLAPEILKRTPNLAWVIIGSGPKFDVINNFAQKNGLENVVRILGPVPYTDLPKYYQSADLFVLLTHPDQEAEEGWGTVFMEAAASGLPTVAGKAGGSEEAVVDGKTGRVVDVYNNKKIADVISEILLNPDLADKMGSAAWDRADKEFRWMRQIKKLS